MQGIHCFSSKPISSGRSAVGSRSYEIAMPEFMRVFMAFSATQWRKTNGPIKLYTDSPMYEYLHSYDMLKYWDEVNTEVLDSFCEKYADIDNKVFWSAAKFACYAVNTAPFACIDTDLIVWKKLNFAVDTAFGFSHMEICDMPDCYPPISLLSKPIHYNFHDEKYYSDFASNMSITYFGSENFKDIFVKEAISYMTHHKNIPINNIYVTPEILYMEQRLPLALANKMDLKYESVINSIWSPKDFCFIEHDDEYKDWFFAELDNKKAFTHLWFYKKYLDENKDVRENYLKKLKNEFVKVLKRS